MAPLWNAMMMLLAIFVENTASQLVERDDGYVLIQRHKDVANGMFSSSVLTTGVENADDPDANTYCIIGSVDSDDFRFDDGRYELQLIYKYSDGTTDTLDWSQTSWVNAAAATGVDLSRIVDSYAGNSCGGFHGLAKSSTSAAYVDGSPGCSSWWHAVASVSKHGGGIPAHQGKVAYSSELWVQKAGCTTHGCDELTVCDDVSGECIRDCDVLHIDEFLTDCSLQWESRATTINTLSSDIATNTEGIASNDADIATNAADIAAVEATANSNGADIDSLETRMNSVEGKLVDIQLALDKMGVFSAEAAMGNVEGLRATDLVQNVAWTLNGKDVIVAMMAAINMVLITTMAVMCCRKQRGIQKYEAVSISSD